MLAFVVDSSVLNHTRAIYNVLDFLGDIGGLYDGLKIIAWFLTKIFTHGSFENYLNSKIFFKEPEADNS